MTILFGPTVGFTPDEATAPACEAVLNDPAATTGWASRRPPAALAPIEPSRMRHSRGLPDWAAGRTAARCDVVACWLVLIAIAVLGCLPDLCRFLA